MLDFLLLWLLLLLPGLALLHKLWPQALEHGPLGVVSLGYVASFALLTPVCLAGYVMHWPVWVLALGYVLAVVGSIVWGWRNVSWPAQLPRPSAVGLLVGCLLVADLWLSTRSFSYLRGDAGYHVARVNSLLTQGLNNYDPLVPRGAFQIGYHSNLYHGLMAAFAWLTGRTAIEAWGFAFGFAKLAVASGGALLASVLLGSRFWSWTVAGVIAAHHLPYGMLSYPNTLALDWLVPTGLAIGLEVMARPQDRGPRLLLAAVGLTTVQVHGMYYVFLVMMIGFALTVNGVWQWRRGQPLRPVAMALAALLLASPWVVIGRFVPHDEARAVASTPHPFPSPPELLRPRPADPAATDAGFVRVGGMRMLPFGKLNWQAPRLQLLLCLIIGVLWPARRAAFLRFLSMMGVVAAVIFIPPLCELVIRVGGDAWMVMRISWVLWVGAMVIFPGVLVLRVPRLTASPLVQVGLCGAMLWWAHIHGVHDLKLYDRFAYLGGWNTPHRVMKVVMSHRGEAEVLAAAPQGSTIWAPIDLDYRVTMLSGCYPLAAARGYHGGSQMDQRRADVGRLIDERVPLEQRLAILRYYGVRHFYAPSRALRSTITRLYPGRVEVVKLQGTKSMLSVRNRP